MVHSLRLSVTALRIIHHPTNYLLWGFFYTLTILNCSKQLPTYIQLQNYWYPWSRSVKTDYGKKKVLEGNLLKQNHMAQLLALAKMCTDKM